MTEMEGIYGGVFDGFDGVLLRADNDYIEMGKQRNLIASRTKIAALKSLAKNRGDCRCG